MQIFLFASLATFISLVGHASLSGTWEKGCEVFEEEDFLTSRLELGEKEWRRIRIAYEEGGCLTPWIVFEEQAEIVRSQGEELDLRVHHVGYRPLSAEVAEALNLGEFCGLQGWKEGIFQEVTGRECGDFKVPAAGSALFTRMKEEAGLFVGEATKGNEGDAPGRRHRSFERRPYQRAEPSR